MLLIASRLAAALPSVVASRRRRGPRRPGWTFGFELFTNALREAANTLDARTWNGMREGYDALANPLSPALRGVARSEIDAGGVPAEWFIPRGVATNAPVVLFFHGGAYIFGSMRSHGALIARIARAAGARVLAPSYRLAPENPFPAAIDDAFAVYRWLVKREPATRIVLAGDSAGGGLATALMLRLREAGDPLPAGAALLCPWVDLMADSGSMIDNAPYDWGTRERACKWRDAYLDGHDAKDPLASPVYADLTGLPPLLVQVGEAELLRDQGRAFAERAKAQGTDARLQVEPDMVHDWHTFADVFPRCGKAIESIGDFVREVAR